MRFLVVALLLVPLLAGCLGGDGLPADPIERAMQEIGEPIVMHHDHTDHRLHTGSHNLEFVAWSTLGVELGENGFANFVIWEGPGETLAFVAVDGDTRGGFVIADISDPRNITVIGSYMVPGNSFQEVRVTPSGAYAVLNVQSAPGLDPAAGLGMCSICIHVVDVRDRSAPALSTVTPVELLGTHNFDFHQYGDGLYLFAVGQPLNAGAADPGNHVWVYRFVETDQVAVLVHVSSLEHTYYMDDGRSFPHDVMVQQHPVTGQVIAYISYWDGGHVTFDVSMPYLPLYLGQFADAAPSDALAVHWIWQEEWLREGGGWDGRVIAWSAPEIGTLETGTGVIRALDVTDPANLVQVGTWQLPGDELAIDGQYLLSPHTVHVERERMLAAVAHYHAGVWILEVSDPANPRHVAYYLPHGDPDEPYTGPIWWKKPNFNPEGFGPNVYQARWHEGLLWITDRGTGLYVLEYTGPVVASPLLG